MSKRCTVCDVSNVGSIYHEGLEDELNQKVIFTDDGHGNDICVRCADVIQHALSEMEADDEEA